MRRLIATRHPPISPHLLYMFRLYLLTDIELSGSKQSRIIPGVYSGVENFLFPLSRSSQQVTISSTFSWHREVFAATSSVAIFAFVCLALFVFLKNDDFMISFLDKTPYNGC
jgi:hypothetical protein